MDDNCILIMQVVDVDDANNCVMSCVYSLNGWPSGATFNQVIMRVIQFMKSIFTHLCMNAHDYSMRLFVLA
jgi:hypothetical protein